MLILNFSNILFVNKQFYKVLFQHKKLSSRQKTDDRQRQKGVAIFLCAFVVSLGLMLFPLLKENTEVISTFVLSALVILDFSFRFFIKKNSSAMIFPYLTLPIARKILLRFIVVSDLQKFGVWGIVLIYCAVLLLFSVFTFWSVVFLFLFVLLNNYLIALLKTQFGAYSLLLYPLCFVFISVMLFIAHFLNPIFMFLLLAVSVYALLAGFYYSLKEKLYDELNRFAV